MSSPAGVQQLQLTATLDLDPQADGAASAVFDDFDVTVIAPYCWGESSYCRRIRTRWGPPAADPCIFAAAEADMGQCIQDIVDDAHWTRGFGTAEAAALDATIQTMLSLTDAADCIADSLPAQLRPKFDLRSWTIDAAPCCVLAESGTYVDTGAGIVIVRIGTPDQYRPVHVHATHPRTDTNTEVQALELFRQATTHSVVIAGARRDAGSAASACQPSYGASDAAHNADSITWVASRAVASHYANIPVAFNTPWTVLEPHGMGASTCPGVDIFLTAGKDMASENNGALARLDGFRDGLAAALAASTVTTPAGNGSGCTLFGGHNTAGRLLNGLADHLVCDTAADVADVQSHFMHLEQKIELRTTASSITDIASAINATWSLGSIPPTWEECPNGTAGHLSPTAQAAQPVGFPITPELGAASALPNSSPGLLLTLRRISTDCTTAKAVARSYGGHAWEGLLPVPLQPSCTEGPTQCTIGASIWDGYRIDAVEWETPPTEADAAARLLLQGTFGPTVDSIAAALAAAGRDLATVSSDADTEVARIWVANQMVEPPTLLREYYRRRTNTRVTYDPFSGPSMGPCDDGSRWSRHAFHTQDVGRIVEVYGNFDIIWDHFSRIS